jgi:valyl-tRNA synthetase
MYLSANTIILFCRDWCLSRQLWWGHRVPAYLCKCNETGKETWVAAESEASAREKASQKLNSKNVIFILQLGFSVYDVNLFFLADSDTRS